MLAGGVEVTDDDRGPGAGDGGAPALVDPRARLRPRPVAATPAPGCRPVAPTYGQRGDKTRRRQGPPLLLELGVALARPSLDVAKRHPADQREPSGSAGLVPVRCDATGRSTRGARRRWRNVFVDTSAMATMSWSPCASSFSTPVASLLWHHRLAKATRSSGPSGASTAPRARPGAAGPDACGVKPGQSPGQRRQATPAGEQGATQQAHEGASSHGAAAVTAMSTVVRSGRHARTSAAPPNAALWRKRSRSEPAASLGLSTRTLYHRPLVQPTARKTTPFFWARRHRTSL